jgi:gluconolactonase
MKVLSALHKRPFLRSVSMVFGALCAFGAEVQAQDVPMPPQVAEGAQLQVVYESDRFFEGPTWDTKSNTLFFTAHPNKETPSQILRVGADGKAAVWMNETKGINGMTLSRNGSILAAQGRAQPPAVVALDPGAAAPIQVKVLGAASEEAPMTQTNDLDEDARGGIYFTCPDFGAKVQSAVYYLAPDGKLTRIISQRILPNGVEVSNDGKTLYVSDSFEKRIYAYPVKEDGMVNEGGVRIFFDPPTTNMSDPDGITTDADGNLYFAMRGGIWVVSPQGKTLGLIPIKEFVSNVAFGGTDGRTLYMTARGKVYSMKMNAKGFGW